MKPTVCVTMCILQPLIQAVTVYPRNVGGAGSWPGTLGIWKRAWTTTGQQHYVEPEEVKNTAKNVFLGGSAKYLFGIQLNTFLRKQYIVLLRIHENAAKHHLEKMAKYFLEYI